MNETVSLQYIISNKEIEKIIEFVFFNGFFYLKKFKKN